MKGLGYQEAMMTVVMFNDSTAGDDDDVNVNNDEGNHNMQLNIQL